jgi:hypothetical protein
LPPIFPKGEAAFYFSKINRCPRRQTLGSFFLTKNQPSATLLIVLILTKKEDKMAEEPNEKELAEKIAEDIKKGRRTPETVDNFRKLMDSASREGEPDFGNAPLPDDW